jgi:hypothetical protein
MTSWESYKTTLASIALVLFGIEVKPRDQKTSAPGMVFSSLSCKDIYRNTSGFSTSQILKQFFQRGEGLWYKGNR